MGCGISKQTIRKEKLKNVLEKQKNKISLNSDKILQLQQKQIQLLKEGKFAEAQLVDQECQQLQIILKKNISGQIGRQKDQANLELNQIEMEDKKLQNNQIKETLACKEDLKSILKQRELNKEKLDSLNQSIEQYYDSQELREMQEEKNQIYQPNPNQIIIGNAYQYPNQIQNQYGQQQYFPPNGVFPPFVPLQNYQINQPHINQVQSVLQN